ncbi:GNAT family N-acetyltransferase [Pseudoclostridium thermosuccinogenes]|uniref:GNAT family N-acetyltransferase n=1 Tax=Clostridium thermosuccinogenes TaxID=84032 RepID=UPI002FDAA9E5
MTVREIEKSFGICGLVCALCGYKSNCAGCRCKDEDCSIKSCCLGKGLDYCFLCDEFPCGEEMFKSIRLRAFNMVAKECGLEKLAEYLMRNHQNGIQYHRSDGIKGDYDRLQSEQEVIALLKEGRLDPYVVCPTYESRRFLLRLVSLDDAEDLLKCYSNSEAQRFFNDDGCDFGYGKVDSLEKMQSNIKMWLDYYNGRHFIRFSIIDKATDKAVGTVEMFGGEPGVMRIDIMTEYEDDTLLSELIETADHFFNDFDCGCIVTKAIPEAAERIKALTKYGYAPCPKSDIWSGEHYYIKTREIERAK